jgi:hypothetical protein
MTKDEIKDLNDLKIVVAKLDTKLEVLLPALATKEDFGRLKGAFEEHAKLKHTAVLSKKQLTALVAAGIPVLTALAAYLSSLIVG